MYVLGCESRLYRNGCRSFPVQIYGAYRYAKNNVYYGAQSSPTAFSGIYNIVYADETRYSAVALLSFHSEVHGECFRKLAQIRTQHRQSAMAQTRMGS